MIGTLRSRAAAGVDGRSQFELGTGDLSYRLDHRRSVHLIEQLTRVSSAEAARRIRLGAAIRARCTLDGRAMSPAEKHLVDTALTESADIVAVYARVQ